MKNIRKIVLLLVAIIFVGTVKIPAMASEHLNLPITSVSVATMPTATQDAIFNITYTVPEHNAGDTYYSGISVLVYEVGTNRLVKDGIDGGWSTIFTSEEQEAIRNAEAGTTFSGTFAVDLFWHERLEGEVNGTYLVELWDNVGLKYSFEVTIGEGNVTPSNPCGGSSEAVVTVPKETPAERFEREYKEKVDTEKNLSVESFASNGGVTAVTDKANVTGKVYNISRLTTVEGYVSALNKIAKDSASSNSVAIYSDYPMFFNSEIMTTILDSNKTFVYTFKHEGHIYKVTIPAGAKLDLGENRAEGPLYIGSVLGTSVLVE